MNNRIQELANEAGMYVDVNGNPWPKWMGAEECEVAYAKFAELIVRECAKRSEELGQPELGKGLMKHFGVEE